MSFSVYTREQAKAYARMIRAERAASGTPISHSAALEAVAHKAGCRDWNTLSARLSNAPDRPLQVGDRVEGRYLKQPFSGRVLAVRKLNHGQSWEIDIGFDEPVDVVTFDAFSAFRRRVKGVVSSAGVSYAKTSDGIPHLVVAVSAAEPAAVD